MKKIAVILYGPPGSGKGTQANLLASKLGMLHFDTGKFCEQLVHDPDRQSEKLVRRERELFDTGKLMTPSFVLKEVSKQVKAIRKAGWGVIFSGSPRTMYEAEGLLPVLDKLYGKKKIFVFKLELSPALSIRRNSKRLMCKICGHMVLTEYTPGSLKNCPVCAGPLYRRTLDKADIIKIRLQEYKNRTLPILELLKKRGIKIYKINASPAPYKVFSQIYGNLKNA